jgi:hypothetical protein
MHDAMSQVLESFVKKWAASGSAERANKDLFLAELCDVLEVPRPNPATGDAEEDTYVFEREAKKIHEEGPVTLGRIDLYKEGCFILEAKQAAECDWSGVEPAIFGTLLERALDPKERHALGAHYTPRAYVERLVRPTIEEPLRADWDVVQALARRNVKAAERASTDKTAKDKLKEAVVAVRAFHQKLCEMRVLDPACGSGNFLYVTLDLFKRLEGEVLALLESLGEKQTVMHMESVRVTPAQFHGIEIKRWAKEIAELALWIGYLQWHFRMYGKNLPVPEPVLKDYKNIECRDAVLAYDGEPELVRDEKGKPVTRWDGETMKVNPVTGEKVPDESARVNVYMYKNPRKAEWPEADFVVGNPPFIGNKRMRLALGDGYVEALRAAHNDIPDTSDLVMYWWNQAVHLVRREKIRRFGFITTNSITQTFNRKVIQGHLAAMDTVSIAFAIPDHPWVDSVDGADVRVAMTVVVPGRCERRRLDPWRSLGSRSSGVGTGSRRPFGGWQRSYLDEHDFDVPEAAAPTAAPTATAWPKKLPGQIAAIRDLVARTHEAWTIESVCATFKGAKKTDVEEVLESLEALGLVTGYTHKSTRRWKSTTG